MNEVLVNADLLEKQATYVSQVNEKLEKVATAEEAFAAQAPGLVDAMIAQGVLRKEARDAAVADLVNGGLAKCAEVISFLTGAIQPISAGQPAEKKASAASRPAGKKESDARFEEMILG